tara:strand:+ start:19 stop:864 length:846 start_codon:yes stop_codon:yes gene_type:complete
MKDLLVCTFSGGRTSAFMAKFINESEKYDHFDKKFIFANTGKENEETLKFINKCQKQWKLNIIWLEAKINNIKGKGTNYKIVNFKTASRNGQPFEDLLKSYSMPNNFASNCTRELKVIPINKYVNSLNYDNVITAMGIRYDERHRKSINAKEKNIIYPLCDDIKADNKFIREWWDRQKFDLKLKDYEGNCDLCFKKSTRKKLTLIKENPKIANWWLKMENKFSTDKYPRFDLRTNLTINQLIEKSKKPFKTIQDLHELNKTQVNLFNNDMDLESDCFCKIS